MHIIQVYYGYVIQHAIPLFKYVGKWNAIPVYRVVVKIIFFFLKKTYCNVFSCTRIVCAQYHVKSEYYWRQAHSAMVVVGKLGAHLHLHHTFHAAHDDVLVSINRHHTQIEVYQSKIATKHAGQYA